jgi:lipid-binding SYLF domain-containing protein
VIYFTINLYPRKSVPQLTSITTKYLSKEKPMRKTLLSFITLALMLSVTSISAFEPDTSDEMQLSVAKAILDLNKKDPGMEDFINKAAGFAVYPRVGKAGIGIGGAHGKGLVIANDKVIANTSLSQVTVGFQLGGQVYAQFVFFEDETALGHFQRGNYESGAQASAVAATAGASADVNYDSGVAVMTNVGGGLMYEATVSGQKFKYEAID